MQITQEVREYAAKLGIEQMDTAVHQGLQEKAKEYREKATSGQTSSTVDEVMEE